MTAKIYTVSARPRVPVFLVLARHEEEARELVRGVLRKETFAAKLRDGESERALVTATRAYEDGRVLPLILSEDATHSFDADASDLDFRVVECTRTVEMMVNRLSMAPADLITAVAEESKLALAYRRHQKILDDWLTD
jgi:hypothetical protein